MRVTITSDRSEDAIDRAIAADARRERDEITRDEIAARVIAEDAWPARDEYQIRHHVPHA